MARSIIHASSDMGRKVDPNIRVDSPKPETPNIAPPAKLDLVKLESEQIDLLDGVNENDITYIRNPSKNDEPPDIADIEWPDPLFMPPLSQANYPYPPDATEIAWTLIDYLIKGGAL